MSKYFDKDGCFCRSDEFGGAFIVPSIDERVLSSHEQINYLIAVIKDLEDRVEKLEKKN